MCSRPETKICFITYNSQFNNSSSDSTGFCVSENQRCGGNSTNQKGRLLGQSSGFSSCLIWVYNPGICSFTQFKSTTTLFLRGMKTFVGRRRTDEGSRRDRCWRKRAGRWTRGRRRRGSRKRRRELGRSSRRSESNTRQCSHYHRVKATDWCCFCLCLWQLRSHQKQREEEEREREQQRLVSRFNRQWCTI